ncbi:vesicle transport protein SFT2B isoform X2 [Prunus dulcis]|uniref:vesicle transport protein SFT2B isoform X2 n=1 Tax=Prunus dulcis TaxID=3755 RepID=UPI001482458B|nr:vesicle transport protein SFT2B isoform X2 [Prunus dulcis]
MWAKLNQSMLEGNEEGGEGFLDEESDGFCALSATQSLIVFAKPIKFAVLFTFGNLLAVGSTAFLFGPGQQMRMMFDSVRVYATAIYLGCVVIALICALLIHSKILTIIAIICEVCALIWYSLSYIPFARRIVSDLMFRLFDTEL